jgi:hypothetical protein
MKEAIIASELREAWKVLTHKQKLRILDDNGESKRWATDYPQVVDLKVATIFDAVRTAKGESWKK